MQGIYKAMIFYLLTAYFVIGLIMRSFKNQDQFKYDLIYYATITAFLSFLLQHLMPRIYSAYFLKKKMKKIKLIHNKFNKFALVDNEDYEYLNQFKWYALKYKNTFYARRFEYYNNKQLSFRMHREILGITGTSILCDHINLNGLDNRKVNLRKCINSENTRNRRLNKNNTTGFKGVQKRGNKFISTITVDNKLVYLGMYDTIVNAANAYNNAAKKYHGDFASLNKIKD